MKLDAQCKRCLAKLRAGVIPLAIAILSVSLALPAAASLGGDVDSVQADATHMQAMHRIASTTAKYTVHEIQFTGGTVVREYVSPSGQVFGVAWQGPGLPDMQQLFGSYFAQYAQGLQAARADASRRARRAPILIQQPGLVVQMGGHFRAFSGSAYIPDMLPQGVGPEAIR
jgi:hypothetical protein